MSTGGGGGGTNFPAISFVSVGSMPQALQKYAACRGTSIDSV